MKKICLLLMWLQACVCLPPENTRRAYEVCTVDADCPAQMRCTSYALSRRACRPACVTHRDCPLPEIGVTAVPTCGPDRLCVLACVDVQNTTCVDGLQCIPFEGSPPYGYCP